MILRPDKSIQKNLNDTGKWLASKRAIFMAYRATCIVFFI